MKESNPIQQAMFHEMREKHLFEKAREYAYQYIDEAFDRHLYPHQQALKDLDHFNVDMPEASTDADRVIEMLHKYGSPATLPQIGGRYFGFVNGSAVPAGIAAKQLTTFWDQNAAMQTSSPVASQLESVVEHWLQQLFHLPENSVAGYVTGTSSANFCALAAARYRILNRLGWDINEQGLFDAPRIRVVAGDQAHSSILKAVSLLGFGKNNIEWVGTDDQGRLIADQVPELDNRTIVILQAGNVNTGSFDPFDVVCEKARQANAWVHIDGAFGLWAAAVDQLKHLTKGMEKASSWAVDGHKTLNTPYDCGIVLCEDKEALMSAMHMSGSYLVFSDSRDGMFYSPDMSRRARIFELWATMKYLGKTGIDQMVYGFHLRARQFAGELEKIGGFEVLNEVVFNQVLVRCRTDELTTRTIERIQALRTCWLGGSVWEGRKAIRISVCSWATTPEDVRVSVRSMEQALREVS